MGEHESSEFKRNLNGGPQADDGVERKLSGINRELKEMGPQADDISGQQSPAIKSNYISTDDTDDTEMINDY